MELKTTPTKLKLLLEAGILPKIKPLFDPLILTPTKDVLVNQQNHGNILALYHTYQPSHFETYNPSEGELHIPLPHLLLDKLKTGFKSEFVVLKTDKKRWSLDDTIDHNDDEFQDFTEVPFPTTMTLGEHGYLPDKVKPDFSAIVDVSTLNLPEMDTYTFDFKSKKFTVSNPKSQNFTRKLEPKKLLEAKPVHFQIDADYLNLVTKHLEGDIYISYGSSVFTIAKKNETNTQTYLIATMLE